LAAGLSMDAFAVSVCLGLKEKKHSVRNSLAAGLYFGVFQAVMPLIGFAAATLFAKKIIAFDHWIAFALLCFLGGKMIIGSFKRDPAQQAGTVKSFSIAQMLTLAFATSIDALAVGVSFAFLDVRIIPAVLLIGMTTFLFSVCGVIIGSVFGTGLKSKAELTGGIVLVLIGIKIILEHLGLLS